MTFLVLKVLYIFLRVLGFPHNLYKPNVLRLLLGNGGNEPPILTVTWEWSTLPRTTTSSLLGEWCASFSLCPSRHNLVTEVSLHNKGWEKYPKLVISEPWMVEGDAPSLRHEGIGFSIRFLNSDGCELA